MLIRSPAAQRSMANPKLLAVIEPLTGVPPGSHLSGRPPPGARGLDDGLDYKGQGMVPLDHPARGCGAVGVGCLAPAGDQGRCILQMHYGRRDPALARLHARHRPGWRYEGLARGRPFLRDLIGASGCASPLLESC